MPETNPSSPTQKLFPPKPQGGEKTQFLLDKKSENVVVREKYTYDPKAKTLEHQKIYGNKPPKVIYHPPKPTPTTTQPPPRIIKPSSPEGLERIAQKIPKEVVEEARTVEQQMVRAKKLSRILKGIGIASLAGAVIGLAAFAIYEYSINKVLNKIGPETDLSSLLPSSRQVIWLSAPYTRHGREEVEPYYEPNVVAEDIIINPPQNNILAFGIALQGLPDQFTNSTNINELGEGNSDWLCETYGGYLICRSTSAAYPLQKGIQSVVSLQFHLPALEVQQMLAQPSGTRQVYLIIR